MWERNISRDKHKSVARMVTWYQLVNVLGTDYISPGRPLTRAGPLCRDPGISVKHIKNQLRDYMTTGPCRSTKSIPVNRAEFSPCDRVLRASLANRAKTEGQRQSKLARPGLARSMSVNPGLISSRQTNWTSPVNSCKRPLRPSSNSVA